MKDYVVMTKAQVQALDVMPKNLEWNEDDLTYRVGIERTEHPLQAEGVPLSTGVVAPWVKPNWPSNWREGLT